MVAVPGDSAGFGLPFEHEDFGDAGLAQLACRRKARRPAADDDDIRGQHLVHRPASLGLDPGSPEINAPAPRTINDSTWAAQ